MNKYEYDGCFSAGLKLTVLIFIILALLFVWGCAGTKEGCWKGMEPKFRYDKKFNK